MFFYAEQFKQGAPNYGPRASPAHEAISSGRKYSLSVMKQYIYETFVDLLERNISRKNSITKDVLMSGPRTAA